MFHFEWPRPVQIGPVETFEGNALTLLAIGVEKETFLAPLAWQERLAASIQLQLDRQMGEFKANVGQVSWLALSAEESVLLVGLGELSSLRLDLVRGAFCQAGRYILKLGRIQVQLALPQTRALISSEAGFSRSVFLEAAVEGLLLAQDPVGHLKELPSHQTAREFESIAWKKEEGVLSTAVLERSEAVLLTRRMVNANADEMTPQRIGEIAQELCQEVGSSCACEIFNEEQLAKMGMGLLLAVARAAVAPPRLVVLRYLPEKKSPSPLLIVGKGITYDTGGLKLKTAEGMLDMRCDMAGAAIALAAFIAHAKAKRAQPLVAVLACAENAIGSCAFKLGDVILSHAKKSVEITNTDAEGRLVLADALSYAIERFQPRQAIDVATLTGSAAVAVGHEAACLMSDDETLVKELLDASERTGERLWRLPLYEEYLESLKSDVATIKNSGSRLGASSIAAIFIKQFVPPATPWAHLDIAPVAFLDKEKGIYSKLASGFGVRLLLDWLARAIAWHA